MNDQQQARELLSKSPQDVGGALKFIGLVVAILGTKQVSYLIKPDREHQKLLSQTSDPSEQGKIKEDDAWGKVNDARDELLKLLHSRRVGGGRASFREEEEKPTTETAIVVTPQNDYYSLLGVDSNASQSEIEIAYKNKLKSLNLEEMEKRLRASGLSDKEIQDQLNQARTQHEYFNEAYENIGSEDRRREYDNFKSKYSGSKTTTAQKGPYSVLGVSPNASYSEIMTAYRRGQKEFHPDYIDREFREGRISQKDYDLLTKKSQDINIALSEIKEDWKKNDRHWGPSPEPQNVYVTFTPRSPETKESAAAREKTADYVNTVSTAGPFEFDSATQFETNEALKNAGFSQEGIDEIGLSERHIDTALVVHTMGVTPEKFEQATGQASESGIITPQQEQDLNKALIAMEGFDEKMTAQLAIANREPEMTIQLEAPASPEIQSFPLERQNGYFKPDLGSFFKQTKDLLETSKATAGKALKATTKKAAEEGVKKLTVQGVKKGAKEIIKKGATWLATKLGITAAASVIAPGVGTIVTVALQVLGALKNIAKKFFSWLPRLLTGEKDTKKAIFALGAVMLAGGAALGSTGLALAGAGTMGVSYISSVGAATAGAGAASFVTSFFAGVVAVAAPIFNPAIIVAVITIPIFVIFTVFIINNSALVVPYGGFDVPPPGVVENPYLDVEKEANPSDAPNDTTVTVDYTITITAKEGDLTNIGFSDVCNVTPDTGQECPDYGVNDGINDITGGPEGGPTEEFDTFEDAIPDVIPGGTSYVISYSVTFPGGNFNDSLVTDTFTVNAQVAAAIFTNASGIANVCFGECPTGCFEIVNPQDMPSGSLANLEAGIANLVGQHPGYAEKVCAGGTVPICYYGISTDYWGCHNHGGNSVDCAVPSNYTQCDIILYPGGLLSSSNAEYILAHEAGHHLDATSSYYSEYHSYDGTISELPYCSYPATSGCPGGHCSEGFAEAIALYAQLPSFWDSPSYCGTSAPYSSLYPNSYQFAKDVIYEE